MLPQVVCYGLSCTFIGGIGKATYVCRQFGDDAKDE